MADQMVTVEKLIFADKDVDSIGEAANEVKVVTPRYGNPYKSVPLAVQEIEASGIAAVAALNAKADEVVAQGFYESYTTEALLLAAKPDVSEMRARADDTRKIWRWSRTSAEGVVPVVGTWTDTGLSDLDQAKDFANTNPLFKPGVLTNVDDLNDPKFKKDGKWSCPTNATASLERNFPFPAAGELITDAVSPAGIAVQTYKAYGTFGYAIRATDGSGNWSFPWILSNTLATKDLLNNNHVFTPVILTNDIDLNTIKERGVYIARQLVPALINNYPTTEAGVFIAEHIVTGSTGTLISQTYKSFSGKVWNRGTNSAGDTPTEWVKDVVLDDVLPLITAYRNAEVLPVDTDVRTLTTPKLYLVYSNPTTPLTTTNLPVAGKQFYVSLYYDNTVRRMVLYSRDSNDIYTSWYWGTFGWSAWDKLTTDKQLIDIQNRIDKLAPLSEDLHADFMNPFKQTNILLVGDSITWGMGGSAGSPIEPRDGDLGDVRNTVDTSISKTWANLLRTWIAKVYGNNSVTADQPGSGFTVNQIRTTWSDTYQLIKMTDRLGNVVSDSMKLSLITYDSETTLPFHGTRFRLVNATIVTLRPTEMEIPFVGDNLTIDYSMQPEGTLADSVIEVYLDDVLHGTINYYATSVSDASYTVTTTSGSHNVRIKNIATNSLAFTNIAGFTVDKKIYVRNDGVIGSSTKTWLDRSLFEGSVRNTDDFVIMMLGTNDRGSGGGLDGYKKRIRTCATKIKTLAPNSKLVLMSSTFASNESETLYKFHMKQVADVTEALAVELNVPFINHYSYCAQNLLDGEAIWSDGLHLSDVGNRLYFENIIKNLFKV